VSRVSRIGISALLAFAAANAGANDLDGLTADGLYTWRVAAVDNAPDWCCYRWQGGSPSPRSCNLDSKRISFSSNKDMLTSSGEMQIFATIEDGEPASIRALSTQCAVHSERTIVDLGEVPTDHSLDWLEKQHGSSAPASDDALHAIAIHRSSAAARYLGELAAAAPSMEQRKDALFWIGQVRISDMAADLERFMFRDPSSKIREHAAFSWSQSGAANRSEVLIRQGRDDPDAKVRAQAWFWLAQTGAADSETAITRAIEHDRAVSEDAVFALSQLPGERAVDALFKVLGNRDLPKKTREQALFWLAQSDSDRAYAYLDQLLAADP
jgi:HEAT repeats